MQEVNTVRYTLSDTSVKFASALANFNDGHQCTLTCIEHASPDEAHKWYSHQKKFEFAGLHCAKVHFIDSKRVFIEHLETDIDGWIKDEFESKGDIYWNSNVDLWWDHIKERFINIFRIIMEGLRLIHSKGLYHGNLDQGIAITRGKERPVVLYNMTHLDEGWQRVSKGRNLNQSTKITQNQGEDYVALDGIINKIMNYAHFRLNGYIPQDIPKNQEVELLCLLQLRNWHSIDEIEWCLNPALFWEGPEKVRFLRAAHWLIYKQDRFDQTVNSLFYPSWKNGVKSAELQGIMAHQGSNTSRNSYCDGVSQLILWRNAQEHYYDHIPSIKRKYLNSVKIHELFTQEVNILAGAVRAVSYIFRHRLDVKLRVAFLEQMMC